jgi:hypothetical protein
VSKLDRRDFCLTGGHALAFAAAPAVAHAGLSGRTLQAGAVVAALAGLADGEFVAGAPDAPVTGIAVLANPTLAALRRLPPTTSLILSPETPFYARSADAASTSGPFAAMTTTAIAGLHDSPAYRAKQAFIAERKLTIVRLIPRAAPDVSAEAVAARLGWTAHRRPGDRPVYNPRGLTVSGLIHLAHAQLGAAGGLRFIGDPAAPLRSVLVIPGTAEVVATTQALRDVDALLTGDVREWEVVTYIHDSIAAGMPKALVATGRILSEQPFIERCALALRQVFPGIALQVPVAPDPFWRVQA